MGLRGELNYRLSNGKNLLVTVSYRRGMKHIYLYIHPDSPARLELRCAPNTALETLYDLLRSKESWIISKLDSLESTFDYRKAFPYLGENIALKTIITPKARRFTLELKISEGFALLKAPYEPTIEEIRSIYEAFYKANAPAILTPLLEKWSRKTGLKPLRVGFRRAKSRWGSCSSQNTISLNTRLVLCPPTLQEYVILHELCHIRHKNHSKAFWSLVESWMPNYKERRKALHSFAQHLR